jgi:hypothetical protein
VGKRWQGRVSLPSSSRSNGAVISLKHVVLSARNQNRELHQLVEADWDGQVEETAAHEFSVVFPSRKSLQISAHSGRLFLPLNGTVVNIRLVDSDPAPVEMLQEVWVHLTRVPQRMRRADRLLAGMRMLGRPVCVDEDSIRRCQPVRMLFACRNPDKLGSVQLFHKKLSYNIGVHVECAVGASSSTPPPPPPAGPADDDKDEDDDVDDLSPSHK